MASEEMDSLRTEPWPKKCFVYEVQPFNQFSGGNEFIIDNLEMQEDSTECRKSFEQ